MHMAYSHFKYYQVQNYNVVNVNSYFCFRIKTPGRAIYAPLCIGSHLPRLSVTIKCILFPSSHLLYLKLWYFSVVNSLAVDFFDAESNKLSFALKKPPLLYNIQGRRYYLHGTTLIQYAHGILSF